MESCVASVEFQLSVEDSPLRSEEHTSELQSRLHLVCRLLLEKKKPHPRAILRVAATNGIGSAAISLLVDISALVTTRRPSRVETPTAHATGERLSRLMAHPRV